MNQRDDQRCADVIRAVQLDPGAVASPSANIRKACGNGCRWLGRCLNDPKILLLDEPFSNVDLRSAREMVSLLADCAMPAKLFSWSRTKLLCSKAAADEFVWMEAGQIVSRTPDLQATPDAR